MLADIVKIHCLTHHANFPMSRTSRIVVCKEGADEHTLTDNFPYSGSWIYCCNCQTFVAWEIGRASVSIKQCPFCHSSLNPRLYVCDHCAVTMLDFDDQALRKHHTVLNWGMPQPACPACHQFPGSTPKQHFCQVFQVNLATARPACPFCGFKTEEAHVDGSKSVAAKFGAALAEAEARAREAEERRRLAEDAVRKEIELRVRAERKAEEIEKKVTGELMMPSSIKREIVGREDVFPTRVEAESRARVEAEQRVPAPSSTEAIERLQAEWRMSLSEVRAAEARAAEDRRQIKEGRRRRAEAGTAADGNGLAIAIYAGIAVVLFIMLILILYALIRALGTFE